jgi:hypothetical protein
MSIFSELGLSSHNADKKRSVGANKNKVYFSYRIGNGKKHIVINLDAGFVQKLGWSREKDKINVHVNGTRLCGLEAVKDGTYSLIEASKNEKGVTRYEIKITWDKNVCPEPMVKGAFPLEVKEIGDGKKSLLFSFPEDVFVDKMKEIV